MGLETKNEKFRRLATARGDRILKEIALLGNMSNERNYEYSQQEVQKLFTALEAELRSCKARFSSKSKSRRIEL